MPERVLVCVGWPYANNLLHVGQVAGAYLPADLFARYHRQKGNEVAMVSGSDCHGTPITVAAERDSVSPREIADRYHAKILEVWERLGIVWELYTTTLTPNHYAVTQDVFLKLLEHGYLEPRTVDHLYDPQAERFLPDRYVEGTCPRCGYNDARGDQCDSCGATLDAVDLINPRSKFTGATPVLRPSEHFYLRLSALQGDLKTWLSEKTFWRRHVLNFAMGSIEEGLEDRAITRDISWGVPIPVPGYDDKRIYVWFDAVIGYLSATKEWAQRRGQPDDWKRFWEDPEARSYYFIGKDNIPFHTIIWPGMLMGYRGLNLPYDVPANQYVNVAGGLKQSKSRGTATWMLSLLDRYDPDVIRFYLASVLPETADSEFREEELVRTNNDVLIATWGNLANRVISMVHRNFAGVVPETGPLSPESVALGDRAKAAFGTVGAEYEACHFRNALRETLELAQAANKYLDERAPWKAVKSDLPHAAETLSTALSVINALKALFHPVLPFSTARLHEDLGQPGTILEGGWAYRPVAAGTRLGGPRPLYTKLELADEATA